MRAIERKSIRKDKRAFTGLEAAIVLTAFVVVAAVFSYVVLNAGFFTTQQAKSTIHTGVEQATSSVELTGDVIGYGNTTANRLDNVTFFVRLTAGQNPVNINRTIVTYTTTSRHVVMEKDTSHAMPSENDMWSYSFVQGDGDNLLEADEKAVIYANLVDIKPNTVFSIELKPPEGTTLEIERIVPRAIYPVMNLH